MKSRKLLSLTAMTILMLSLLAGLPLLAQATSETVAGSVDERASAKTAAGRGRALPLLSPPRSSLLLPGNPIIHPVSNTHTAPATSTVSITYDEAISPATVSTRTFAVHAMQTGLLTQTYSVAGGSISLTPAQPFKPGELVQVSATTGTLNLSGRGPISPTVWQFRVAATNGYGYFADSGQTFPVSDTIAVALGDVNGDGHLDAFVSNWVGSDADNQIWLNRGDGMFAKTNQSLGNLAIWRAVMGDLDSDGDLDIFARAGWSHLFSEIWFNDGTGIFTKSDQGLTSPGTGGLVLGDLDGDGDLDAFVGHLYSPGNQVWLNDGTGVFTDTNQRLGNLSTYDIALGDLDGDADLDAFVANGYFNNDQPNQVWLNDGTGVFTNTYPDLGSARSTGVDLGDLDGDGDLDAFITHYQGQPEEVWFNDGTGVFTDSLQRLGNGDSWAVELGDLDGDGDLDAYVANANLFGEIGEADRIWLNDGNGTFAATPQSLGRSATFSVALGDVDDDGDLDALVGNADPDVYYTIEGAPIEVWLNVQPRLFLPLVLRQ